MDRPPFKSILVKMPTFNRSERLKLEGIFSYAHDRRAPEWNVELLLGELTETLSRRQLDGFDGIIAYVSDAAERQRLVATGRPLVLVEDILLPSRFPHGDNVLTLLCDHAAEGRTAADYFLRRHFRNFAFVGSPEPTPWSDQRRKGYVDCLAEAGCSPAVYASPGGDAVKDERTALANWLRGLPRPIAVFTVHDFRSRQILAAARTVGLEVPRDVAILGVDNDEIVCTTTTPALSSIPTHDYQLGYAAGRLLNELLAHRSHGGRVVRIRHRHVVSRLSTDCDALEDPFVARALQYVRSHLASHLNADILARQVGYSKRMLQLRAERALGVSLGEEVRKIRLDAAIEILTGTDIPIAQVAEQCGFTSTSHLSTRIKEATGLTPLALRKGNAD